MGTRPGVGPRWGCGHARRAVPVSLSEADAGQWAERAVKAGGLPDNITADMLAIRAAELALAGRPQDGLRALAELANDPDAVPPRLQDVLTARGMIRMMLDDLAGAYADLRGFAPYPGWEPRPFRLVGLGWLAEVEYRLGRWDDALLHAEQATSLIVDTDQTWQLAYAHAIAVPPLAARGLWAEAEAHLAKASEAAVEQRNEANAGFAANAAVHLAACRGDAAAIVAAARPLQASRHGALREPGLFTWADRYACALVALGRLDEAQAELAWMSALADRRGRRSALAAVALARGELAAARRSPTSARAAFQEAISLGECASSVLDQARAHDHYGRFLRRAGSRRAAIAQLTAARTTFAQLRAQPFLDRCDAELAACGSPMAGSPTHTSEAVLTPQERAVSRLVCAGHTNREVASELVLSVKTVGYHLANTYAKLGVSSRTQLAARLAQDSPVP
jgi:DNA-binding NarL/FixJ family response regulator